jgi:stage II sporulation protein D
LRGIQIHTLALSLGVSLCSEIQAVPGSVLRTRGATLELPFEIKILVKVFESQTPQVQFSGYELRAGADKFLNKEELICRQEKEIFGHLKLLKDPFNTEGNWLCKSGNFKKALNEIPLKLQAGAGFTSVNKDLFRGSLEIYSKDSKLYVVNSLALEPYLAGLVNREIRSDFPPESVKAQIVAARSYALATAADRRKRGSLFDLSATESDQVYDGSLYEDAQSHRMVNATVGEVLFHQEDILKAYYHSSNGGYSELPQNVWGDSKTDKYAYLARNSPWDEILKNNSWQVTLSPSMGQQISPHFGRIVSIRVLSRTPGKRIKKIQVNGEYQKKVFSGPEFRALFGNRWIKSTLFQVESQGNNFVIKGKGWGHGVGLSQLGAREMARSGKNYKEILSYFYPYSNVRKLELGEVFEHPARNFSTPTPRAR